MEDQRRRGGALAALVAMTALGRHGEGGSAEGVSSLPVEY